MKHFTRVLLNRAAFQFACDSYAIEMKMTKADGTVKPISDQAKKAIEASIITYLVKNNLTADHIA